jgi:hypothetical protein
MSDDYVVINTESNTSVINTAFGSASIASTTLTNNSSEAIQSIPSSVVPEVPTVVAPVQSVQSSESSNKKKRKHKKEKKERKETEDKSNPSDPSKSSSSDASDLFRNSLNKLTDHFTETIRELRREYKHLDLEDKMDRMFAVFYMDKCDPKQLVFDTFASKLKMYNDNQQLAFLHTMAEIDSHISDIMDLVYPDEDDISDEEDLRSEHRKEMDKRRH